MTDGNPVSLETKPLNDFSKFYGMFMKVVVIVRPRKELHIAWKKIVGSSVSLQSLKASLHPSALV